MTKKEKNVLDESVFIPLGDFNLRKTFLKMMTSSENIMI